MDWWRRKYSGELEKNLRGLIAGTLGLDANGERQFVIRKEFIDLINQFGEGVDVFLPDKPAGYWVVDAECRDGKVCNGAERCVNDRCAAGSPPCFGTDERCDESSRRCVSMCHVWWSDGENLSEGPRYD